MSTGNDTGGGTSQTPALPVMIAITLITVVGIVYNVLHDDLDACRPGEVPAEAYETVREIKSGGPFDHPGSDGSRFGNYDKELPEQASNYYREYTVTTPGLGHRGARRIVTGGDDTRNPEVYYYTDDHYDSFCELDVN